MSSTDLKRKPAAPPKEARAAILGAALEILRSEGHGSLTVRHVAQRAGCSTIGVYTWFGGKDGLVDALLIEGFESFDRALQKAKRTRSPGGGLVGQARAYREWALANATSYRVMFMQAVPGHEPSPEAAAAGLATFERLRAEVRREQLAGTIAEPDAEAVALMVWGLVHGLVSIEISQKHSPLEGGAELHKRAYELSLQVAVAGFLSRAK